MTDLAVLALVLGVGFMVRRRIDDLALTMPMVFVAAGLLLGPDVLGVFDMHLDDETIVLGAELTLAMVLFADAARIDTAVLRTSFALPVRLLGIGLPLTIAMGTLVTKALLSELSWAEAALVAAILAPTDAALGEAVVSNPRVPVRIRQALNVESGLNDGLVVPVVAVFVALSVGEELEGAGTIVGDAAVEVGLGILVGVVFGRVMAAIGPWIVAHGWTDDEGLRLIALSGAVAAFATSVALGGNGFIAAFVCGLVLRFFMGATATKNVELVEEVGQVGASATFVIFGALMVWPAFEVVDLPVLICALGTLTVGRMLPVVIAMLGTGLSRPTVAFLGWFGPRGLASMLFGLLVVTDGEIEQSDQLFAIIAVVVVASVVLHGMTASPLARRYSDWFALHGRAAAMPEAMMVPESRLRWRRHPATNSSDSAALPPPSPESR